MDLLKKIEQRKAKTAVIGLGYVGLPLLVEFGKAGYDAVGIDIDNRKVDAIQRGVSYIPDVPDEDVKKLKSAGRLTATTDYGVLKDVDIISICVPTPLRKSGDPDISYIVDACVKVSKSLHEGQLIILESTTYPGTTEEIVLPIFSGSFNSDEFSQICSGQALSEAHDASTKNNQAAAETGKSKYEPGKDFFIAFSPERVDPGNPKFKTKDIPKVIGGYTPKCSEASAKFYGTIFPKVVPVTSTRAAEMVKLLENTFRNVNIALANEMALMCDSLDMDVWEVISAAATKPFGFMPFYPGPGLGGHCIPIDPLYLTWKARLKGFEPKFIELATDLNQKMPGHVVSKVQDKLNEAALSLKNSKILVIGMAYKKDVSDTRESPSIEIINILNKKGAITDYYDPYVPIFNEHGINLSSIEFNDKNLKKYDCVVIATDHSSIDYKMVKNNCRIIVDTRNALNKGNNKI